MSSNIERIVLQKREAFGKSPSKLLKKSGLVPCVLHDKDKSISYSTPMKELIKILTVKRFFLTAFELVDDSGAVIGKCLAREVIYDPITDLPVHIDFLKIENDSKILVEVPIIFQNKDAAPGLLEGGQMKLFQYSVRMRVNFKDMPKEIQVDLGGMKLFDIIRLSDLNLPKSASILYLSANDKIAFMKGVKP